MKSPSPKLRAVFDELRAADDLDEVQIDRAWQRFETRTARRRRAVIGLWAAVAVGAAALVLLLLSSIDPRQGRRRLEEGPPAAEYQTESESAGGVVEPKSKSRQSRDGRAARTAPGRASPTPDEPASDGSVAAPGEAAPTRDDAPQRMPLHRRGPSRSIEETASDSSAPETPSEAAPSLAEELALLDAAERALRDGELDRAEQILDDHATRFPTGLLLRERKTLRSRIEERRTGASAP